MKKTSCGIAFFIAFFFICQAIFVFGEGSVFNDFDDPIDGLRFVMSGHESRRMHVESGKLIIGVRDTLLSSAGYVPTPEEPLELSIFR